MAGRTGEHVAGSVIVVEDEQRVARVIVTILERAGYDVTVAASLAEALLALAGRSYDVLVADLILPDGDGLAFVEEVRCTRNISVVLMSGLAEFQLPLGVVSLVKPFTPDQLEGALAEAFGTSHARPSPFRSRNGDEQPRRERRLGGSGLTA